MLKLPLIDERGIAIKAPSEWREITLATWIEFSEMLVQLNKGASMLEDGKDLNEMSIHEIIATYPSYVIKVVGFWTGLTDSELSQLHYDVIVGCFTLISSVLEKPEPLEEFGGFKFKGKYYMKPKTVIDINGNEVLAKNTSFINMVEYLQLSMQGQKVAENVFTEMPKQIALLFKIEGEDYNEDVAYARSVIFKDLPMDIVWQIAFFLDSLRASYETAILKSLTQNLDQIKEVIIGDTTISSIQRSTVISRIWKRLKSIISTR
jgi:hypothetical protein